MLVDDLPGWALALPSVNALLNALATLLLIAGYIFIRRRRLEAHKRTMLTAFGVSIVFLACYLAYHFALHHYTDLPGKPFRGTGPARAVYYAILVSHVVLAAVVPVLASITIYRGLQQQWPQHRRIAKVTLPIWLYVSVTGVIIYVLLYWWP